MSAVLLCGRSVCCKVLNVKNGFRLGLNDPASQYWGVQRQQVLWKSSKLVNLIPEAPKKPTNPFFQFSRDRREVLKLNNPDGKFTPKLFGEEWKALPEETRKEYNESFSKEIENFKVQQEKWWRSLTVVQKENYVTSKEERRLSRMDRRLKRKFRLLGKPRRSKSAFNYYMSEHLQASKGIEEAKVGNAFQHIFNIFQPHFYGNRRVSKANLEQVSFSTAAKAWKELPQEEKQKYIDLSEKDKLRHKVEREAWNLKMLKEGHGDLLQQIKNVRTSLREQKNESFSENEKKTVKKSESKEQSEGTPRAPRKKKIKNGPKTVDE